MIVYSSASGPHLDLYRFKAQPHRIRRPTRSIWRAPSRRTSSIPCVSRSGRSCSGGPDHERNTSASILPAHPRPRQRGRPDIQQDHRPDGVMRMSTAGPRVPWSIGGSRALQGPRSSRRTTLYLGGEQCRVGRRRGSGRSSSRDVHTDPQRQALRRGDLASALFRSLARLDDAIDIGTRPHLAWSGLDGVVRRARAPREAARSIDRRNGFFHTIDGSGRGIPRGRARSTGLPGSACIGGCAEGFPLIRWPSPLRRMKRWRWNRSELEPTPCGDRLDVPDIDASPSVPQSRDVQGDDRRSAIGGAGGRDASPSAQGQRRARGDGFVASRDAPGYPGLQ